MEARRRGSWFSQCSMIQSFTAEQIAAPMRLADRDLPAGERIADRQADAERIERVALHVRRGSEPGRSPFTRQSGRQVIGAPSG